MKLRNINTEPLLQAQIHTLNGLTGGTAPPMNGSQLAKLLGCHSSQVTRGKDSQLFTTRKLYRLSRIGSRHGIDAIADTFSADGKRTLPIPLHLVTNDTISDNVTACVEYVGMAVHLDAQGRFYEAEQATGHAIRELHILRLEFEAKRLALGGDGELETATHDDRRPIPTSAMLGGVR